jgi:hypothetical protein
MAALRRQRGMRTSCHVPAAACTAIVLLWLAVPPHAFAARGAKLMMIPITRSLSVSEDSPTWGTQIPKIVYDGRWFYVLVIDHVGAADHNWGARIFESRDGRHWSQAFVLRDPATGNGFVYQPLGLLLDRRNRLHILGGCFTGGECYPGVAPAKHGEIYTLHVVLSDRARNGAILFARPKDLSIRTPMADGSPVETVYQGLSVDPAGATIYQATSDLSLHSLWMRRWDAVGDHLIASDHVGDYPGPSPDAPCGRALLYPQVRPYPRGTSVLLTFKQLLLCNRPGDADAVISWRSDDGGRSFGVRTALVRLAHADGVTSWVNNADSTVDQYGVPHFIYYVKREEPPTGYGAMYYQRGLFGRPARIGTGPGYGQLVARADRTAVVFTAQPNNYVTPVQGASFIVLTQSRDGKRWSRRVRPLPGYYAMDRANLLSRNSGTRLAPDGSLSGCYDMIVPAQRRDHGPFSTLFFVRWCPARQERR